MNLRQPYRKALKKHKTNEILNMYRDKKLDLNKYEWNHLHRKIDKENQIIYGIKLSTFISSLLCLVIVIIFSYNIGDTYQEKIIKCKNEKHHLCSEYEIGEMFKNGKNNR